MQSINKNIARIPRRCPENITSVVKCVKLLFPKVLRKEKEKNCVIFLWRGCMIFLTTVTTVKKNIFFLSTFVKGNLTHLANNVIFSGQRFAILAMFYGKLRFFVFGQFFGTKKEPKNRLF